MKTTMNTPGDRHNETNADLKDGIEYVKKDPMGLISVFKWIGGFVAALLKPGAPKAPR